MAADTTGSNSNLIINAAHALEKKGFLGSNTSIGTIVATGEKFGAEIMQVTHGHDLAEVVKTAISEEPSNHRMLRIVSDAVEAKETLPRDIINGTARLPDKTVNAFKGFAKKVGEALNDPQVTQVVDEAKKLHETKTKTAMAQVSGLSSLIGGASEVATHGAPASTTINATVYVDTPAHK